MNNWIIIALMGAGLLLMVAAIILLSRLIRMKDAELRNGSKMELKVQALKIIMPLKVQAYERFLLVGLHLQRHDEGASLRAFPALS